MAKNSNLAAAKRKKNDEFYTRREDIEAELFHYKNHFEGKIVYCNCDDPASSEFWKFFQRVFKDWKLKKLIATHFEPDEKNYSYKIEMHEGDDWQMVPARIPLPCNGDFRSAACIELLKEADIVVTNPPFSLYREYVDQLITYGKKFVIIGNKNSITYKEIFPLLKNNEMWIGYTSPSEFYLPDGDLTKKVNGLCRWFTNLDIKKRHEPLDLRGNYFDPEVNPKYDNYDAIDVKKVNDIPCDFNGVMGVPLTFLDKYNPDQFELIGMGTGYTAKEIGVTKNYRGRTDLAITKDGKSRCPYSRILIRRKRGDVNES